MKLKMKSFVLRHKMLPLIIGFIYLYLFIVVSGGQFFGVSGLAVYAYHAVDFSMGFCTRILAGDIYRRLVGVYNEKALNLYLNVLFFVFICLLSVLLERFLTGMPRKYSKSCLLLLFLFITGPFTLGGFVESFGTFDFYWIFLTVISLLLLRNKYLRWLIPAVIFLMVLIHYGSVLCYVAGLLLLMLFMAFRESDRKEKKKWFGLFTASALTAVAEVLYFLRFERDNVKYPIEVFHDVLLHRGTNFFRIYDYYFYKSGRPDLEEMFRPYREVPYTFLEGTLRDVYYQIVVTLKLIPFREHFWFQYVLGVPLFLLLFYVLLYAIRNTDHKGKKMTLILMIALFFCISLICIFFSLDIIRWLSHAFLVLFGFVFYLLYYDYREVLDKLNLFLKNNFYPIAAFCLVYSFTTAAFYTEVEVII